MVGQFLKSQNPKSKQEIHYRLTPKCFLVHVKRQILPEQSESSGNPITWEKLNMPMYRKRPYIFANRPNFTTLLWGRITGPQRVGRLVNLIIICNLVEASHLYLEKFHKFALVTRVVMETLKNRRLTEKFSRLGTFLGLAGFITNLFQVRNLLNLIVQVYLLDCLH